MSAARIGFAASAIMLSSAAAAAEIDVYGRLNLTLQNSDEAVEEKVELQNNASRKLGDATNLVGFYTTGDVGGTNESNEYAAMGIEHNF